MTVARMREIPPYYRAVEQGAVEAELRSVPAGDYTVTIVAENAWGKQSQPMTVSVHVEGKGTLQILPEYIWQRLLDLKDYFVCLFR